MGRWWSKSKLAAIRGAILGHPMYGMVIIINNTVLYTSKFLRK